MIQPGELLGRLLGPLLRTGLPLMKNVIKPLAKSVLIPLGLTAAASAADAGTHKTNLGSGHTTTLIISNNEMEDIRLSSNMIGNSEDETNFPHKLLLTNRQVANLCKAFANY